MTKIPFAKLHGAENDFLITWKHEAPDAELPALARRICARTTGVGADGWMLAERAEGGLRTRLFNSDGSEPEISGNGTRCAAAFALIQDAAEPPLVTITTGAGPKELRLLERHASRFIFEMEMGLPNEIELHAPMLLQGQDFDATTLNVGNPQCAIFVDKIPADWRAIAAEAERHPRFPNRTNVSFVRVIDPYTVQAVFYERGAGETRSSGTGSTGAGIAAILRGKAKSPVEIKTPAGPLILRWDTGVYLTGPAEFIAEGSFFVNL
ncbi:MAG: diaminopimelate epimerase [Acidobacteriaceae bacterium]|nr:diaminopimelate epimerase [Acidobacteriaceae bacterium]